MFGCSAKLPVDINTTIHQDPLDRIQIYENMDEPDKNDKILGRQNMEAKIKSNIKISKRNAMTRFIELLLALKSILQY